MATLESLTEKDIKQVVNNNPLKKARSYMSRVSQGVRSGHTLHAQVRGSKSYTVEIDVAEDGIHAVCSCPYDWGGYCKHVGAVLLLWLESPGSFAGEQPAPRPANSVIETFAIAPPATAVPKQKPAWLTTPYANRQQQYQQNLHTWLDYSHKVQELRQLAKRQGLGISGTRKEEIIQQIAQQITQPGIALKILHSLDSEHRQVYDALAVLHPSITHQTAHLAALAQLWGPLTQFNAAADVYAQALCRTSLAIPGHVINSYPPHLPFVPTSLQRILPPLLADRIPEVTLPEHTESGVQMGQAGLFLQRLHQILLLLEQSSPPLRPPMPRPRQEKFHQFLREWDYLPEEIAQAQQANKLKGYDPEQSFTVPPPQPALLDENIIRLAPLAGGETQLNFLYHLLLAAGLLQPGSPVTVWRQMKEQFLQRDEAAQWAILVRTYFSMAVPWSEMWLMLAERPSIQVKRRRSGYYTILQPQEMVNMLSLFRAQVLHLLACLPGDRWFSLREVTDLLHSFWPNFNSWGWNKPRSSGNIKPDWYLALNGRFLDTATNKADWNTAQGAFIQHVIQGPLHWLGLADVSVEYGQLVAFRLHSLGDLYFDKTEAVPLIGAVVEQTAAAVSSASAADAVSIEGDVIIVQPTAVSAQTHNYLDNLAKLEETTPTRFVYRLSSAAIHQIFESGQTLDQLLDGWQQWLPVPMPDAIQRQLTGWWQAYGQVRLYEHVTVIEFGDEYALAEMKAATSLEKHMVAEISPSLVIIPTNAVDVLVAELEKAGYTPKQTDRVER
ncbi:MAG: helicase-associated domain-containing protein [Chloroflexi bacterium]|nr:helicase-associated domain-containing protein [Chloroflexota bacterium]